MKLELYQPQAIRPEDFEYFRSKIQSLAGLSMSMSKRELVHSRLRPRIETLQLDSFADYRYFLESISEQHPEWQIFVNLLTTNKTEWFREIKHFEFLTQEFLPFWLSLNKKKLKIWCAAGSTGEEPYSISTILHHHLPSGISYEILATDINTQVLNIASNGVYLKERIDGVPKKYQPSTFISGVEGIEHWVKVRPAIEKNVNFQFFNLKEKTYPWSNYFDLIFCRNVLIYFSNETILQVINNFYQASAAQSILIIGHSESLHKINTTWKHHQPSIYSKGRALWRKKV
jgi:chemotaxis methyl-accepting protein methylase